LLYLNKREEARIGDALDQGGILNVTIAEKATVPALPQLSALSYGFMGLVCASTLSITLAFVADYLNPAFRTPDEIVAYLGSPVLASLPRREG
jgi:capsular polysaccharide biosynthesis protein